MYPCFSDIETSGWHKMYRRADMSEMRSPGVSASWWLLRPRRAAGAGRPRRWPARAARSSLLAPRLPPPRAPSVRRAALRYALVYFMFPSPNGECPTSVTDRLWHSTTPPCAFFRVAFRSVRRVRRLRAIRAGVGGSSRVYLCCRFGVVNICVVRTITVLSVRSSRVDIFNDRRFFAKVSEISDSANIVQLTGRLFDSPLRGDRLVDMLRNIRDCIQCTYLVM